MTLTYNPGFAIEATEEPMGFRYGEGGFGPEVEYRKLDDIRASLRDSKCDGPEIVYAIAMDVGNKADREAIVSRNLLYGAVVYAKGLLGDEPVRSQGHIHAVSASCGASTCEVYEIWDGKACVYMQERAKDDPGRCYAVMAEPGDVVIVPPNWAHCAIVADVTKNLVFGAWCVRDYGFDYEAVRRRGGIAWYPVVEGDALSFVKNEAYQTAECIVKPPREYTEFGIRKGVPVYRQFCEEPDKFLFVARPQMAEEQWNGFVP